MKFRIVLALLVALALLVFAPAIQAQQPEKMVSIPEAQLTDSQKATVVQRDMQTRVDQYGKWVGLGDEVGKAVNGGLSAVTTQANNFAQTPVGKWTMFVIIFKVLGEKVIQYLVGISMFIIGIPLWIWSYRRFLPHDYVRRVTYAADGKTKAASEYDHRSGDDSWIVGHWIALAVLIAIGCLTMFVGN